jgi:hypothetical protein
MGLEVANYIPELVPANPAGSDPVSAGDDHIRNVKLALKQTFPAFVGSTATPKSVALTEDQINDAALNGADETIAGAWTFSQTIIGVSTGNLIPADLAPYTERAQAEAITGAWTVDGKKIGYRNPALGTQEGPYTPVQADEGTIIQSSTGAQLTTDQLEQGTTMRFITLAGGAPSTITAGTAFLTWFNGSTPVAGPFTVAPNSVVELYWGAANSCYIFGNGISG